jgi:hypothetical protein
MKVYLSIKNQETGETRRLEQESASYEKGQDQLLAQVPDGWIKLHWQTDQLDNL